MVSVKSTERIPAQPLLDYVKNNGGLAVLLSIGVPGSIEIDTPPFTREVIERDAEESARFKAMNNIVSAAINKGTVPLHSADRLCVEGFGIHPAIVWGSDWYTYGDPISEHDSAWVDRWVREGSEAPQSGSLGLLEAAA